MTTQPITSYPCLIERIVQIPELNLICDVIVAKIELLSCGQITLQGDGIRHALGQFKGSLRENNYERERTKQIANKEGEGLMIQVLNRKNY